MDEIKPGEAEKMSVLKAVFSDELDRLREDFNKELLLLGTRLQNHLEVSDSKVSSYPEHDHQHNSTSWFWPADDFVGSTCHTFARPKAEPKKVQEEKLETNHDSQPAPTKRTELSERELVNIAARVLLEHGAVPIGKMGSLMHKAANDHTLPSLLKERFGGLKKFLQTHPEYFVLGDDHPYNPHVRLSNEATSESLGGSKHERSPSGMLYKKKTESKRRYDFPPPPPRMVVQATPIIAMDCEMVGVGSDGSISSLARCSIVNYSGQVLFDKYVKPTQTVTDYRTHISGIRPEHLVNGESFAAVRVQVANLLRDRVLVGHSLKADLQALALSHDEYLIRDTAYYPGLCPTRPRSLKTLVRERLGVNFQIGEHDSVEDARAVLALYKTVSEEWEQNLVVNGPLLSLHCRSSPFVGMHPPFSPVRLRAPLSPFASHKPLAYLQPQLHS